MWDTKRIERNPIWRKEDGKKRVCTFVSLCFVRFEMSLFVLKKVKTKKVDHWCGPVEFGLISQKRAPHHFFEKLEHFHVENRYHCFLWIQFCIIKNRKTELLIHCRNKVIEEEKRMNKQCMYFDNLVSPRFDEFEEGSKLREGPFSFLLGPSEWSVFFLSSSISVCCTSDGLRLGSDDWEDGNKGDDECALSSGTIFSSFNISANESWSNWDGVEETLTYIQKKNIWTLVS
jgi:hypothetical protein